MNRNELLEDAFLEDGLIIKDFKLRNFSAGTLTLCRKLKLSLFTEEKKAEEISDEESLLQLATFAWMQSAPIADVLRHVREGTYADEVELFSFGLALDSLGELTKQIKRLAAQSAAAIVKVQPKKNGAKAEDAPPNS